MLCLLSVLDKRRLIDIPQEFERCSDVECVLFFRCTLLNVFLLLGIFYGVRYPCKVLYF